MQRLHEELYTLDPTSFFLPSFLTAVSENSELSLRRIMLETSPGIFTFEMLQPRVCELLIAEVENGASKFSFLFVCLEIAICVLSFLSNSN